MARSVFLRSTGHLGFSVDSVVFFQTLVANSNLMTHLAGQSIQLAEVRALAVVLALKPRVCDLAHLVVGRMGQPGLMGGVGVLEGAAALGVWGRPCAAPGSPRTETGA